MPRSTRDRERSPATAPWKRVWALYDTPGADPAVVLSAVREASSSKYPAILMDGGVMVCLDVLSEALHHGALSGADDAARLSEEARRRIATSLSASFASEWGWRVVSRIAYQGLVAGADPRPTFAIEMAVSAVDYLVSRDLSRHLGSKAIPNIGAMSGYKDAISDEARRQAKVRVAGATAGTSWPALVRLAWG